MTEKPFPSLPLTPQRLMVLTSIANHAVKAMGLDAFAPDMRDFVDALDATSRDAVKWDQAQQLEKAKAEEAAAAQADKKAEGAGNRKQRRAEAKAAAPGKPRSKPPAAAPAPAAASEGGPATT